MRPTKYFSEMWASPLTRRVTGVVFVTIMVIEAFVLIPSYFFEERDLLGRLEDRAKHWVEGVSSHLDDMYGGAGRWSALSGADVLLGTSFVVGVQITNESGDVVAVGEPMSGQATFGAPFRSADGARYEVVLFRHHHGDGAVVETGTEHAAHIHDHDPAVAHDHAEHHAHDAHTGHGEHAATAPVGAAMDHSAHGDHSQHHDHAGHTMSAPVDVVEDYTIAVRMESSHISAALNEFLVRIAFIELLIAVTLTVATILAMDHMVLRPLARLKDSLEDEDLTAHAYDDDNADRMDEIGDVHRSAVHLLQRIKASQGILEATVAERTAELEEVNAQIRENEDRFRDFAEANADFYWETDANMVFSYFSEHSSQSTPDAVGVFIGRTIGDERTPGISDAEWFEYLDNLEHRRPFRNFVFPRQQPDGQLLYVSISGQPIHSVSGKFVGYRGIGSDVTEQVYAQQELVRQKSVLDITFDGLTQGIAVFDKDHRMILWNNRFAKQCGLELDFLSQNPTLRELYRHEAELGYFKHLAGSIEEQVDMCMEMALVHDFQRPTEHPNLSGNVYETRSHYLPDGGFVRTVMDITERKKDEAAQQAVLETIALPIFVIGSDDRYLYVNAQAAELAGRNADDMIGGPVQTIFKNPKDRENLIAEVERAGHVDNFEAEIHIPGGETGWGLFSTRSLDFVGQPATLTVVSIITDRKQAEQAMIEARDAADAANAAKSDMIATVSHEVRTPMNGVLGMARLMRDTDLDDEQSETLETIISSAESLLRITNDLLDMSKLEEGRLELEDRAFVPRDLAQRALTLISPKVQEKGLELRSDISADLPDVMTGDPHRLMQVLMNLLSNAVKFTKSGSVVLSIECDDVTDTDAHLRFAVNDTGQGVSAAQKKKLFSPYSQGAADVARKYGGTGLGLVICRKLVNLMGGEIDLESTAGKGSSFFFDLRMPIDNDTDIDDLQVKVAPRVASRLSSTDRASLKILQVEDNVTNQKVVERIAKSDGHTVVSVPNGQVALAVLGGETFDLIVMDRHMPVMDGLTATKRIREMDEPICSLPIIGITAGALEMELAACLDAGMDIVLTKPVDNVELQETFAKFAGRDKAEPAVEADQPVIEDAPILVVDDVVLNLAVAKKQLTKLGFAVETESNPVKALEMLQTGRYPVAFVDIEMPELDGMALTRALRTWEAESGAYIPVVAMTGHIGTDRHKEFTAAGMNDILTKPLDIDALDATVRHWMQTYQPPHKTVETA